MNSVFYFEMFLSRASQQRRVNCFPVIQAEVQGGATISQHAPKQSHMSAGRGQPIRLSGWLWAPGAPWINFNIGGRAEPNQVVRIKFFF